MEQSIVIALTIVNRNRNQYCTEIKARVAPNGDRRRKPGLLCLQVELDFKQVVKTRRQRALTLDGVRTIITSQVG